VAKHDPFGERRNLHPASLIEALERFEVDYVVIGGLAAIAHGAQRITQDLDIAIDRSAENCAPDRGTGEPGRRDLPRCAPPDATQ
jgi:hypothetical protein